MQFKTEYIGQQRYPILYYGSPHNIMYIHHGVGNPLILKNNYAVAGPLLYP